VIGQVESAADPRVAIQQRLALASNYNRWIVDQARGHVGRRVLDAGTGAGNLARLLATDRELVVGVDEWDEFAAANAERFAGAPNVEMVQYDLTDPTMPEALHSYGLDSAFCSNVLEHIVDDRAALANMAAALPAGSPIFLLVPAFMALYGEHDRADHHARRYTKRSLAATVEPLPLRIERSYYMNLPGFFAWFVIGRVLRRQLRESDVGLYDRVIPLVRAAETRLRPPFGQSLVALLRTT
jgi:SAM-dependent methyltransferase